MDWYKVPHGLPQDAKLAVIAARANLKRGEMLALWVLLLDKASQSKPSGCAGLLDAEEIAAVLEFDTEAIKKALSALRDKRMLTAGGKLACWQDSQKLSTPRTRAYRARAAHVRLTSETDAERRARLQRELVATRKTRLSENTAW